MRYVCQNCKRFFKSRRKEILCENCKIKLYLKLKKGRKLKNKKTMTEEIKEAPPVEEPAEGEEIVDEEALEEEEEALEEALEEETEEE